MHRLLKIYFIIGSWLLTIDSVSAQNLIPNGGFESYSGCPTGPSELDSALFWVNPSTNQSNTGSPDYYNQCSSSGTNVPNTILGFQSAHGGNAYSGIYIWYSVLPNVREYIEVPFTSNLIADTCYHLAMYINLGNNCKYTTDAIGVYFSDTAITGINNGNPLPFIPQINNVTGNIFDTLNWVLITGDYSAHGGEHYLIIGNFKNDASTNTTVVNNSGSFSGVYCFIDDVSLTPTSPCSTGINPFSEKKNKILISVYPNPTSNSISLSVEDISKYQNSIITIQNTLGETIKKLPFAKNISVSDLTAGCYFLQIIYSSGETYKTKFIKQ